MPLQLSEEIKTLVRGANFAHLATLMSDGSPQVAPVWVDLEGDSILVSSGEGSLKAENTRGEAAVGVSVITTDNPYSEAQLGGRIVERRAAAAFYTVTRVTRPYSCNTF